MPQAPNVKIAQLVLGPIGTNCYLVRDEESGMSFVLDPAVETEQIPQVLEEMGVEDLNYILLTHGHFDHIMGVNALKARYPDAQVCAPEGDRIFFSDARYSVGTFSVAGFEPVSVDRWLCEGDELPFGTANLTVLETPGHTPGSVCYLLGDLLFSGDTLFQGSVGATHFIGGDMGREMESLKKLCALPGDYKVLPGHGPLTTLETERKTNPYLRQIEWS